MSTSPAGAQIRRLLEVGAHWSRSTTPKRCSTGSSRRRARSPAPATPRSACSTRRRQELERFIYRRDRHGHARQIGDLPRGRGVLGALIEDPSRCACAEVGRHPQSYGFPVGHPEMRSFLGVPIVIRGQAWGNLYLTEKEGGGEFTAEDEEAAVVLAAMGGDRDRERAAVRAQRAAPRAARAGRAVAGGGTRHRRRGQRRGRPGSGARADRQARTRAGRRAHAW